jgi:hypothetical protein
MELRHKSNMAPGNIQQRIEKNDISYNNERYYRSKSIPSMYMYIHVCIYINKCIYI